MKEIEIDDLKQKLAESLEENVILNSIPLEFPQELMELTKEDFPDDCDYRKDLTQQRCITIDDDSTKDIDDALFLEETNKGYRLWIHIADVASYLRLDELLYDDAEARATSIYLPDRVIRMLPPLFSEDLCSLLPNENRRAMSFCIDLDQSYEVLSLKIYRSLICSSIKCSYEEVEKVISGEALEDPAIQEKYDKSTQEMIRNLNALTEKLTDQRNKDLSFTNKTIKVMDSELIISSKTQTRAEQMVEECMVLANKEVSRFMALEKLPIIYRIQDGSRGSASYSHKNLGHKDLNIEAGQGGYAYITSPIRRFADTVNQMILCSYLDGDPIEEIHEEFHEEYLESVSFFLTKKSIRARNLSTKQNRICEGFYLLHHAETETIQGFLSDQIFKESRVLSRFQIDLNDIHFTLIGEFSAVPMKWYELKIKSCADGSAEVVSCIPIKQQG